MKAVIVDQDRKPRLAGFAEPAAREDLIAMTVRAAALTNLDIAIAAGRHYFSPASLPAVIGREAVVTCPAGRRLYLNPLSIAAPFGSMAERTLADPALALPVPDGIDDATAAALGNAGLAGWLPLSWRAHLSRGERVLILGATGAAGGVGVTAASLLGAGRVVGAGRSPAALDRLLQRGADAVVSLDDPDLTAAFLAAAGGPIDVVVDYLNGPATAAAVDAMAEGGRLVQVGAMLGPTVSLSAQTLRRQCLDVLGFAYYHAPIERQIDAYERLCGAAMTGGISLPVQTLPLDDFGTAWAGQTTGDGRRYVIVP